MTLTLLAGSSNESLSAGIASELGVTPCPRTIERFDDGELHVEINGSIRGHDVYVVQSTNHPVDEHVMELLFLADACRRSGAARLTAVVPYFGYARQDRRATGREAVAGRVVAGLLEGAGFDRVVAIDLHSPAIEGFFRIPLEHLSAVPLLAGRVEVRPDTVIVSPDLGAVKLAERYEAALHLPVAVVHKTRLSGSAVRLRKIVGEVAGRAPLIVDDMVTTGATIEAAARGLLEAGCTPEISVVATHGLFVGPAIERLRALPIRQLITSDSIEGAPARPEGLQIVTLAPLIAEAIARLNKDESLERLRPRL